MPDKRRNDAVEKSWFRTARVYQQNGQWYFDTREGRSEGPFRDRRRAEECLAAYVKTMGSPFAPSTDLSLEPSDQR